MQDSDAVTLTGSGGLGVHECDGLDDFLGRLLERGPPRSIPTEQPEPVERIWLPADCADQLRRTAIRRRRAELAFILPGMKDLALPPHRPTPGWGRRKRFNSLSSGATLYAASSLEFDVFRDLELDPDAVWFIEQPLELAYDHNCRLRTCRPDVLVIRCDRIECIEVKYEEVACLPEQEEKWGAIGTACRSLGIGYRVLTERHVRRRPRFENVRDVFTRRHVRIDPAKEATGLAWLRRATAVTLADLEQATGISFNEALAMARQRSIALDLDSSLLGPTTSVYAKPAGGVLTSSHPGTS